MAGLTYYLGGRGRRLTVSFASEIIHELEGMLKGLCPVDTGFLRDSIDVEWNDGTIKIDIPVDYASYVVEGTRVQDANDFVEDALAAFPFLDVVEINLVDIREGHGDGEAEEETEED